METGNLQKLITENARALFGIETVKPYQNLVIQTILEHDTGQTLPDKSWGQLVVFPTGYGKSLCFLLPAAMLDGVSVLVYPLLGLMNDQERRLRQKGIRAEVLRGGQTRSQRAVIWDNLEQGRSRIIITNPETLCSASVMKNMHKLKGMRLLKLLVVDEAHVVCEWGQTFRPMYLQLQEAIRELQPAQVLAFTATASPAVIRKLRDCLFRGRTPHIVRADPDRQNISYNTVRTLSKEQTLLEILRHCPRPALVFIQTRWKTQKICWLVRSRLRHLDARNYHAGLSPTERADCEKWFQDSADGVMFATCAYGMGMDKSNIRTVIHWDIPDSIEEFLQESGRAGRDGLQALSFTMVDPGALDTESLSKRKAQLVQVLMDQQTCLRRGLLALMDCTIEHCSGCDVCTGNSRSIPYGMKTILCAVRHYPLRYGIRELAILLSGSFPGKERHGLDPYWGALRGWSTEALNEAIKNLVQLGWLKSQHLDFHRTALINLHPFRRPAFSYTSKRQLSRQRSNAHSRQQPEHPVDQAKKERNNGVTSKTGGK